VLIVIEKNTTPLNVIYASVVERYTRRTQNALIVIDHAGSNPVAGIMNRERYIELDRSGTGLTKEEWEQGWHWCNEWDGMLVGPNTDEALVCSCSHPAIERWKESEEGKKMQKALDERFEKLNEQNFLMEDGK
jgi:hypothetical protein